MADKKESPSCQVAAPLLNQYADGELAAGEQPLLFDHLSTCAECRRTFEAVLAFRRMSRQEHVAVPPATDEAFLAGLVARRRDRSDRPTARRRAFWTMRAPVTLRTAAAALLLVFMTGVVFPSRVSPDAQTQAPRAALPVRRPVVQPDPSREPPVFVFYPGLTIKAPRVREIPAKDPS